MKKNHSKGMTLVELMLYIGIFSIIFSGFMVFALEFSHSISVSAGREDGLRESMIIGELIRWKVHHAERILVPMESATSTELELEIAEGLPHLKIKEEDVARLFRFDRYKIPTGIYFFRNGGLYVNFTLNRNIYEATINLL